MLDANLCIRVLSGRLPELRTSFNAEAEALCISTTILHELLHGAEKSANPAGGRRQVERFTSRLHVLPFDAAAAHSADIRAALEREGRTISPVDLLIAGHARSQGLVVVTGNRHELSRIAGLRCEDWLTDQMPPAP